MRFLPTRIHALVDYVVAIITVCMPYLVGFDNGGVLEWGPILLGAALLLYSLCTNYELGVFLFIPLRLHLALDAIGGAALIAIAVIFGGHPAELVSLAMLGIVEIGASLVTRTVTSNGPGAVTPSVLPRLHRQQRGMSLPGEHRDGPSPSAGVQNVEQLRAAIDSGSSEDKIAVMDPAAAPLGSDAEAAAPHDELGLKTARNQTKRKPD